MEKLEIKFKLTEKEVWHIGSAKKVNFRMIGDNAVVCIVMSAFGLLLYKILDVQGTSKYLLVPMMAILSILLTFGLDTIRARLGLKKAIQNIPIYNSEQRRIITKEGIIKPYDVGEVLEKYEEMYKAEETKYFYNFFFATEEYLIIPKSALKTDEERVFVDECYRKVTGGM